jgi:hypothetical protein
MKEVICPHTIVVSLAVVHLTMLRRAIRCLAPAGPAWTTFKSLVDQGAIPNVDAGKAEAVFATLSSDQLKQLADAAAKLKHKLRCAEQDAAKKDAVHADHIQKLPTRAAARVELERLLAELAAREKSLRDRMRTLGDTPTLVLQRKAATKRLAEVTALLDSSAGRMSPDELWDSEAERRDAEALIDERDAEIAMATALREHLADVVTVSEGLRTVLTTLLAHLDEKLEAANSIAAATAVTATPATGRNTNGSKRRSPRINLGTGLRRDLRMMLAAEKVDLRNAGATQATFAALSKSERDALAQEAHKVLPMPQKASIAKFPANTTLHKVARMLTLLYNVEKGGKVPYEDLSQKQRTLLRGLAYALKNDGRVTLEQVGYVLQHADKMRSGNLESAIRRVRRCLLLAPTGP